MTAIRLLRQKVRTLVTPWDTRGRPGWPPTTGVTIVDNPERPQRHHGGFWDKIVKYFSDSPQRIRVTVGLTENLVRAYFRVRG